MQFDEHDEGTTSVKHETVADFTESEYVRLLDLAASKYRFCLFGEEAKKPTVIWRHDIDYSPHRALKLARLEHDRELRCVYHVLPSSRYYNILEPEIGCILRQLVELGHEVGLHFDMDVISQTDEVAYTQVVARMQLERSVVAEVVGKPVYSLSFHNYTLNRIRLHDHATICGMLNAAAKPFFESYRYVSDSNGIWRHDRLADILSGPIVPRLHVLTHPVWWTPEPLSPMAQLQRTIAGRAEASRDIYLSTLRRDGRHDDIAEDIGLAPEPAPSGGD